MTEYGNYQNKISTVSEHETVQGKTSPTTTDIKGKMGARELGKLDASTDPTLAELSDKSKKILSVPPTTTALLEEYDFDLNITEKSGLHEKTNSVGQPILSELNHHPKLDEKQPDIQMQIRQKKVEESLNSDDFTAKINAMTTEDELEEALSYPGLTKEQEELIYEKLDQLVSELTNIKENKPSLSELNSINKEIYKKSIDLNKETEKELKTSQTAKTNYLNAELKINKENVFILYFTKEGPIYEEMTPENADKGERVYADHTTNDFKTTETILKKLNGQIPKYKNKDGDLEQKPLNLKAFTGAEKDAFHGFILEHYQINQHASHHEEIGERQDEHIPTASKETKLRSPTEREDVNEAQQNAKTNGFKLGSVPAGPVDGKTSQQRFLERLERLEQKTKRLEEQIEKEILKHEILVREIQTSSLNQQIKNTDFKSVKEGSQDVEVENQYKELVKVVNDPDRGFEIPIPVIIKINSIDTNFQKIEKLIHKADLGNINTDDMLEIGSLKKEFLGIVFAMLNPSGTPATKGTDKKG